MVLATSTPVTETRGGAIGIVETIEAIETAGAGKDDKESKGEYPKNFAQVLCIWYLIIFGKKFALVLALFDLDSKINTIYSTFVKELGFFIRLIDIGAQKIDGTILDSVEIVVAIFLVIDKANEVRFFEETFLVPNVSLGVVIEMFFLILSGADVDFLDWELR